MFVILNILLFLNSLNSSDENNSYAFIFITFLIILVIFAIYKTKIYLRIPNWVAFLTSFLSKRFSNHEVDKVTNIDEVNRIIYAYGYSYDKRQDMFYSTLNASQREIGYCRLYDELAAPFGMIIDCEPIYFEYDNKKWLIEFWKGQYDLTTGAEIGIYCTSQPDINIPGLFKGPFYDSVNDSELLKMNFILKKNNKVLFTREDKHWWLTGFRLGEFSYPSELTLNLSITLKDALMLNAFINGLIRAGYSSNEFYIIENTVHLKFTSPHTIQPDSRSFETDKLIQTKNKLLCNTYNKITQSYDNLPDKIRAVKTQSPELYNILKGMVSNNNNYQIYNKIKKQLK